MPEPSSEIEQVLRDTLAAMARSDVDAVGRRTSQNACVVMIGSDPGEWTEGYDDAMRRKMVQTHASIGVPNDRMLEPMLQGGA